MLTYESQRFAVNSIMKKKAIRCSETLVTTKTIWRHNPEDNHQHIYRPKNLRFRAEQPEFCSRQGREHLFFVIASWPVLGPIIKTPGRAPSQVCRDTRDTAARTLSLLSTCTLPLSSTRRKSRTSPWSAARCSCTSDGVSFCKRNALHGVTASWEAKSSLAGQEIVLLLWKQTVQYRFQKRTPQDPNLTQMNPAHTLAYYVLLFVYRCCQELTKYRIGWLDDLWMMNWRGSGSGHGLI
jgi:hypothetical protein